jgi:hypothetical protein
MSEKLRMDKTVFAKQSYSQASNHSKHYKSMTKTEQIQVFHLLMSAAFGFVDNSFPKMDKVFVKKRRLFE